MRTFGLSRVLSPKVIGVLWIFAMVLPSSSWAFQDCPSELNRPSVLKEAIKCLVENQKELYGAIQGGSAGGASSGIAAGDLAFIPGKYKTGEDSREYIVKGPIQLPDLGREMWTMRSTDGAFVVRWYTGKADETHPSFHNWDKKILLAFPPAFSYGLNEKNLYLNGRWSVGAAIGALQEGDDLTISYFGKGATIVQSFAFRRVTEE